MDHDDLLFITDKYLRNKIVNAIDIITGLYFVERDPNYTRPLSKEIRRIIILYAASIIEALLLYLYKREKTPLTKSEYKEIHTLPTSLFNDSTYSLVVAKQITTPRDSKELMLDVLLAHYKKKGIITQALETKIRKTKDIRNTFHLHKPRTGLVISDVLVKQATEAVYETIVLVKANI